MHRVVGKFAYIAATNSRWLGPFFLIKRPEFWVDGNRDGRARTRLSLTLDYHPYTHHTYYKNFFAKLTVREISR